MNVKLKWLLIASIFLVSSALSTTLAVVLTEPDNEELKIKDDKIEKLQKDLKDAKKKVEEIEKLQKELKDAKKKVEEIEKLQKELKDAKKEDKSFKKKFSKQQKEHLKKILDEEFFGQQRLKDDFINYLFCEDNNSLATIFQKRDVSVFSLTGCPHSGKKTFIKAVAKGLNRKYYEFDVSYSNNKKIEELLRQKSAVILLKYEEENIEQLWFFLNELLEILKLKDANYQFDKEIEEKYILKNYFLFFCSSKSFYIDDKKYLFFNIKNFNMQNYLFFDIAKFLENIFVNNIDTLKNAIYQIILVNNITTLNIDEVFKNFKIQIKYSFLDNFYKNCTRNRETFFDFIEEDNNSTSCLSDTLVPRQMIGILNSIFDGIYNEFNESIPLLKPLNNIAINRLFEYNWQSVNWQNMSSVACYKYREPKENEDKNKIEINKQQKEKLSKDLDNEFFGQQRLKDDFIKYYFDENNNNKIKLFSLAGCPHSGKKTFIKTVAKVLNYEYDEFEIEIKEVKISFDSINITNIPELLKLLKKHKQLIILLKFKNLHYYSENLKKFDIFFQELLSDSFKQEMKKHKLDFKNYLFTFLTNGSDFNLVSNAQSYSSFDIKRFVMEYYKYAQKQNIFKKMVEEKIEEKLIALKTKFYEINELKIKFYAIMNHTNINFLQINSLQIKFDSLFLQEVDSYCQITNKVSSFINDNLNCKCTFMTAPKIQEIVDHIFASIEKLPEIKKLFNQKTTLDEILFFLKETNYTILIKKSDFKDYFATLKQKCYELSKLHYCRT